MSEKLILHPVPLDKSVAIWKTNKPRASGLSSLYYEGPVYRGRPTRVFAYLGLPKGASATRPVPAVVLVHGGYGTAFAEWVRIWNRNGFAALAMDHGGTLPIGEFPRRPRHHWSGPDAEKFGFDQGEDDPNDQWYSHALTAIVNANSLLRSRPEIDADAIGLVGISWGGWAACLALCLDPRFRFGAPIYGCGHLLAGSAYTERIAQYGADQWQSLWDPKDRLHAIDCPTLWMTGTGDLHYHPPAWSRSTESMPQHHAFRCLQVGMPHSHADAWASLEPYRFAQSCVGNNYIPARLGSVRVEGREIWAELHGLDQPHAAALHCCHTNEAWPLRKWLSYPAEFDQINGRVTAQLPEDRFTAAFFNVWRMDGSVFSSPIMIEN